MQYNEYASKILNYCIDNNIPILHMQSVNEYIIDNKLSFLFFGNESLVFVDEDKQYVYKLINIFDYYCKNVLFRKIEIPLTIKVNILNQILKGNFHQTLERCILINNDIYLVYKQKYVKSITTLKENIIVIKQLNLLLNTKFFNICNFNIRAMHNVESRLQVFKLDNYMLSDIKLTNVTLLDNKLFFYDVELNVNCK